MAGRVCVLSGLVLSLVAVHVSALFLGPRVPFMFQRPMFGMPLGLMPALPMARMAKAQSRPFRTSDANINARGPLVLAGGQVMDVDIVNGVVFPRRPQVDRASVLFQSVRRPQVNLVGAQAPTVVKNLAAPSIFTMANKNTVLDDSNIYLNAPATSQAISAAGPTVSNGNINIGKNADFNDATVFLSNAVGSLGTAGISNANVNVGSDRTFDDTTVYLQNSAGSFGQASGRDPLIANSNVNIGKNSDFSDATVFVGNGATATGINSNPASGAFQGF